MNNGLDALREMVNLTFKYDDNLINKIADLSNIVLQDLERLEKLENIIDIFKDEAYITIETDIDETGTEFHATLREKGGNGEIFIDEVTREECYLLEEVFGE